MGAFTKATRRITAVATSAVMASSAVFGAGLSNYPDNFNNTGASVVVGAAAQASDTTAANAIIDSLMTETMMYEVTYTKSSGGGGGDTVDAVRSNAELNYGEYLGNVTEVRGFDESDTDVLEDERFDNDISDEDYEQTLELLNGHFNYALRDDVDGVTEITDGIFYESGEEFALYTLEMNSAVDLDGDDYDDDLIGHELMIMGNEFTIADISAEDDGTLTKLVLTGGSQTYALEEGASISVPFGGRTYDIRVLNIDDDEVLLEVDGDAQSIDEYDSEDVSGLVIAVTDLVSGSQHTRGNAVLVIGGQKVTLEDNGRIKINDEDFDDMYEDEYEIDVSFGDGTGFGEIVISYMVGDDVLLQEGDALSDVLFDAFEVVYEGTNDVDYSEIELSADNDDITITAETDEGESLNRVLLHTDETDVWVQGKNRDDKVYYDGNYPDARIQPDQLESHEGWGFLLGDKDDAFLYEIANVGSEPEYETDFDEILRGEDVDDLTPDEWDEELGSGDAEFDWVAVSGVEIDAGLGSEIPFENEMYLDLYHGDSRNIPVSGLSDGSISLVFMLDEGDVDYDAVNDVNTHIVIPVMWKVENTEFKFDEPELMRVNADVGWENEDHAENDDDNSDFRTFVTRYGVMVEYEHDDEEEVTIMVPDEQVRAEVSVVFGGGSRTELMTEEFMTMEEAEARADELEEDGMRDVEVNKMMEGAVSFAISGPLLDNQVTGTGNMIVVGGPAVNRVAAELLGMPFPTMGAASGLSAGQAQIRMFESVNSILVYGWSAADTQAAANRLNSGNLEGSQVNVG